MAELQAADKKLLLALRLACKIEINDGDTHEGDELKLKQLEKKNTMGIIGFDMRIKEE